MLQDFTHILIDILISNFSLKSGHLKLWYEKQYCEGWYKGSRSGVGPKTAKEAEGAADADADAENDSSEEEEMDTDDVGLNFTFFCLQKLSSIQVHSSLKCGFYTMSNIYKNSVVYRYIPF